jgi:solute carrier family 25 phosphate transporter 23/24/25/41
MHKENKNKFYINLISGGVAGGLSRTIVAPLDRIKILMQTDYVLNKNKKYNNIYQSLNLIYREEGFFKLWKGNLTNCIRVVPYSAIQFASYNKTKDLFKDSNIAQKLVAGSVSGILATTATHPLDVIRLRLTLSHNNKNIINTFRDVYQENGARSLYKGYVPTLLSLTPYIAINFATFDSLRDIFNKEKNISKTLLLGSVSAIISQSVCYPLEVVRRRMQLKDVYYANTLDAFKTIIKKESVLGLYKGMLPNTIKIIPGNAVRFAIYEYLSNLSK